MDDPRYNELKEGSNDLKVSVRMVDVSLTVRNINNQTFFYFVISLYSPQSSQTYFRK